MSIVFKQKMSQKEERSEEEQVQEERAIQTFKFPWTELIITIFLFAIGFGFLWLMMNK